MRSLLGLVLGLVLALTVLVSGAASASAAIEDYAEYRPQTHCSPKAKPGTAALGHYVVRRFGGSFGGISRPCRAGGVSEHKEGRAFDWTLDAARARDRRVAKEFLDFAFAADEHGHEDVKARRMGIMYVIWNDHIYSAWDQFEKRDYLASSCKKVKKCSKVLRHRTHVHVSLSRKGGRGMTSWYDGRVG